MVEFLGIALAAFLGAAAAFLSDRLLKKRDAYLTEEAAINNLLFDLAAKRTFAMDDDVVWAKGAGERILESVNHTRTLVRSTRLLIRPRSKFLEPLLQMVLACNTLIEQAEYRPKQLPNPADLKLLTIEIRREAARIRTIRPRRIVDHEPGSLALARPVEGARS